MKLFKSLALATGLAVVSFSALSAENDLSGLLDKIKNDRTAESQENKAREARFLGDRNQQQKLLKQSKAELKAEQRRSDQLKKSFDGNEKKLTELADTLKQRAGTLGEMFGVVRQFAGDNKGVFDASSISAQYPERGAFLGDLAERKELPTIVELETLWLEITREMTEAGQVVKFPATVIYGEGNEDKVTVTRVGTFNAVADGKYLNYLMGTGKFEELSRQPDSATLSTVSGLEQAADGYVPFYLDPSRGVILSLLVQSPSVKERIDQGGPVGYVILGLGAAGLLLALFCFLNLLRIGSGVRKQQKSDQLIKGNPLGEIMSVYQENKQADLETLELKLDEIIIKSVPKIERGVGTVKLIASVAPLLGLLGTVVGMIGTFQAITLFGTGDPKLMAGGISEALVTTMLGLVVAVPTLFAHSLVQSKSRRMIQVLEEQSAGFIARHQEQDLDSHTGKASHDQKVAQKDEPRRTAEPA